MLASSAEAEDMVSSEGAAHAAPLAPVPSTQLDSLPLSGFRDSDDRFRAMIDVLPAAIYTTDAQGKVTHFNPACVELSGRTPVIGSDRFCVTWKLFYPDGRSMPHDECPMAITLKEGRAVRGAEAIAERPDGTRIWLKPYPTPLFDEAGKLIGAINMLLDITERRSSEQALRESEVRFRAFTSATSDAVYRMSPDWTEMRQLCGREFIADTLEPSRTWLEKYISPGDQQRVMEAIQLAIRSRSVFELQHRVIQATSCRDGPAANELSPRLSGLRRSDVPRVCRER